MTQAMHDVVLATLPGNLTRRLSGVDALGMDWRVLGFTTAVALVTVFLFGLLPALNSLRFDVMSRLRDTARGSSPERQRLGQVLVTAEIALALMLLAGAGLTFKSLTRLETQDLGFRPEGVLRALTDFSATRYPRPEQRVALFEEVYRRLTVLPGAFKVGLVRPQAFPFPGPGGRGARFEIFGKPDLEALLVVLR